MKPCKTACEEDTDCTGFTWRLFDRMCELRSGTEATNYAFGKMAYIIK